MTQRPVDGSGDRTGRRQRSKAFGGLDAFSVASEAHTFRALAFPARTLTPPGGLTDAELSVFFLLAAGLSNVEIAKARGCSVRTVANQIARVFAKAHVRSRQELVTRCRAHGERGGHEE